MLLLSKRLPNLQYCLRPSANPILKFLKHRPSATIWLFIFSSNILDGTKFLFIFFILISFQDVLIMPQDPKPIGSALTSFSRKDKKCLHKMGLSVLRWQNSEPKRPLSLPKAFWLLWVTWSENVSMSSNTKPRV